MTDLLERAFEEASKLSPKQQNEVAQWLLDELASEQDWEHRFDATGDTLARLAQEARDEHLAGETEDLDTP